MKLSLSFRPGWTHVKGGRLVEVAQAHAVGTASLARSADDYEPTFGGEERKKAAIAARPQGDRVYCEPGDIAVEILFARNMKLLGHSYLTGLAINLNRYTPSQASWFRDEPLTGRLLEIPLPSQTTDRAAFVRLLAETMIGARYGEADVCAFELDVGVDDPRAAARTLGDLWAGYKPKDDGPPPRAHCLGLVKSRKAIMNMHFQPPRHTSDNAASAFQVSLVLDALRGDRIASPKLDAERAAGVA